jgi:hypothetical protein
VPFSRKNLVLPVEKIKAHVATEKMTIADLLALNVIKHSMKKVSKMKITIIVIITKAGQNLNTIRYRAILKNNICNSFSPLQNNSTR